MVLQGCGKKSGALTLDCSSTKPWLPTPCIRLRSADPTNAQRSAHQAHRHMRIACCLSLFITLCLRVHLRLCARESRSAAVAQHGAAGHRRRHARRQRRRVPAAACGAVDVAAPDGARADGPPRQATPGKACVKSRGWLDAGVSGPDLFSALGYCNALQLQRECERAAHFGRHTLRKSCSLQTECLPGVGHIRAGTGPRHDSPAHRVMGRTLCSTAALACGPHLRALPASASDSSASAGGGGGASSATSVVPIAFRTCGASPKWCYPTSVRVKLSDGRKQPLANGAQQCTILSTFEVGKLSA